MNTIKLFIGCSGYYYSTWKNKFYPEGVQAKNWLAYYSSVFNTVELNGTFYKTPKLADLKKYSAAVGEDFRFAVKVSKYITHSLKLKESKQYISDFQTLVREGLGEKCSYFLFQLPPSFHYNQENLDRILANIPHSASSVIELRHASWWNTDVELAFSKAGFTFCNVDYPGLDTHFMHTSNHFYLRLHGNPILFKSSYNTEALANFYRQFPHNAESFSVYFNNTYYEAGYKNALELMTLVSN